MSLIIVIQQQCGCQSSGNSKSDLAPKPANEFQDLTYIRVVVREVYYLILDNMHQLIFLVSLES